MSAAERTNSERRSTSTDDRRTSAFPALRSVDDQSCPSPKASCCWRQGHEEAAAGLYRKALSIARERKAKLWELRAVISLAQLRHDQGGHAEAQDLLAPIYVWFTEGFDTQDLKDAKALLDCIETAPAMSVSNASRRDAGTSAR